MNQTTKTIVLIVGALAGAFLGYRAVKNFVDDAEGNPDKPAISAEKGLQLGLTAVNAFQQINKLKRKS